MKFEYDMAKSILNKLKHGITLGEAQGLWNVPSIQLAARPTNEPRFILVGKLNGKFYSCIFTLRNETIRLISARRSRSQEERDYHEQID